MEMSLTKLPYGKPVKLLVDYQGYPDGRLVLFEIWRKKGGKEEKLCEVYGVTKGGKGLGWWNPQLEERKEVLPLKREIIERVEDEKFYFIAKIDEKEVKSGNLSFTFPLEIFLEDIYGKAVDGAKCKITFADGSVEGSVLKKGSVEFAKAPCGKFKLELEGYTFVF
jgi:hypothetical protein